jgi:hypothetical protein
MGFDISYSSSGPGMDGIMRGIDALNGTDALVGIPEGNAPRKKGDINNAELLFLFTNGSPLRGQPPRPVIEPAIEASPTKDRIAKQLAAASKCALDGDEAGMMDHLDRAGAIGWSASKDWFTDPRNGWQQDADSTINRKLGKMSDKKRESAIDAIVEAGGDATGIVTTGIDTGQMRRALTYQVEASGTVHQGNATELSPGDEISFGIQVEEAVEDVAEVAEVV